MKTLELKIPTFYGDIPLDDLFKLKIFDEDYFIKEFGLNYLTLEFNLDEVDYKQDLEHLSKYFRKNTQIGKIYYLDTFKQPSIKKREEVLIVDSRTDSGNALLEDIFKDPLYEVEPIGNSKYRVYGIDEIGIPLRDFKEMFSGFNYN